MLKDDTSFAQLQALTEKHGCTIKRENPYMKRLYVVSVPKISKLNAIEMANVFYETELFHYSEPNFVRFIERYSTEETNLFGEKESLEHSKSGVGVNNLVDPNDPYFILQWNLKNTGQLLGSPVGLDIKALEAWAIADLYSNEVRAAILDDGLCFSHEDYIDNFIYENNQLLGHDATGHNTGGENLDDDRHGTNTGGILASVKNNDKGVAGVASNSKLIPIRVFHMGNLTDERAANGISWAWHVGAPDVMSCSWNMGDTATVSVVETAIYNAVTHGRNGKGVVMVFTSGNYDKLNYTSILYPGRSCNTIGVGAISPCGERRNPYFMP
jgi:subtilisin family serine protease